MLIKKKNEGITPDHTLNQKSKFLKTYLLN